MCLNKMTPEPKNLQDMIIILIAKLTEKGVLTKEDNTDIMLQLRDKINMSMFKKKYE